MQEAEKPLAEYETLGDLFVRRLRPEVRPLGEEPVHCADANLSARGKIVEGTLLQAKGQKYSVAEFLGEAAASPRVQRYLQGNFFTYYLCPTDYHRVHSPVSGQIKWVRAIPGYLWPVHSQSVREIPKLFSINERLCIEIETARGFVMVVMVGATNVGKITTVFDNQWVTNRGHHESQEKAYSPGIPTQYGDELAVFNMGSTVVVLFDPKYRFELASEASEAFDPREVKVRQSLVIH
jgi:phosphatidylserine decarboxylase